MTRVTRIKIKPSLPALQILYVFVYCIFRYVWSGSLVLMGIALNIYTKNRSKINSVCSFYIAKVPFLAKVHSSSIV